MTRRGFASIAGLAILALVAAATLALADRFAEDVRQTLDHVADAQLRQLLTAAAIAAQQGDDAITLPPDLAADFTVRVDQAVEGDTRTVTITASGMHLTQRQVLTYERQANGWRLETAQLNPLITRSP